MRTELLHHKHISNRQSGFTLIELIASIAILGVLAAVVLPIYFNFQDTARRGQVEATYGALQAGYQLTRTVWILEGTPGGNANLDVDGITVRFRNGHPRTTANRNHVPPGTPNRGSASSRLFHLFLSSHSEPVVGRTSDDTGWAMLANNNACGSSLPNPRRCWAYRVDGENFARITYSAGNGQFMVEWF